MLDIHLRLVMRVRMAGCVLLLLLCASGCLQGQLYLMMLLGLYSPRWNRIFNNTAVRTSNIALLGYIVRNTDAIRKPTTSEGTSIFDMTVFITPVGPPTHQVLLFKIFSKRPVKSRIMFLLFDLFYRCWL